MATLLRESPAMPFHTDVRAVFAALGDLPRRRDWLLTDLDCFAVDGLPLPARLLRGDAAVVPGAALDDFLTRHEVQFLWGVLSAFPPGSVPDPAALPDDRRPYADGNPALWEGEPAIQHPRAELELVCWDSTFTLLIARDPAVEAAFRDAFPGWVDLGEFNAAGAAS